MVTANLTTVQTLSHRHQRDGFSARRVGIARYLCPSVTWPYCIQTAKQTNTQLTPPQGRVVTRFSDKDFGENFLDGRTVSHSLAQQSCLGSILIFKSK